MLTSSGGIRLVPCAHCGGEGFVIVGTFHANDPGGREARCDACGGSGVEEVETEMPELEDLDLDE